MCKRLLNNGCVTRRREGKRVGHRFRGKRPDNLNRSVRWATAAYPVAFRNLENWPFDFRSFQSSSDHPRRGAMAWHQSSDCPAADPEVATWQPRHPIPQTRNLYVWPATHQGSSRTGSNRRPITVRFRLTVDNDISGFFSGESDYPGRSQQLIGSPCGSMRTRR